jgi:hypothetical protein
MIDNSGTFLLTPRELMGASLNRLEDVVPKGEIPIAVSASGIRFRLAAPRRELTEDKEELAAGQIVGTYALNATVTTYWGNTRHLSGVYALRVRRLAEEPSEEWVIELIRPTGAKETTLPATVEALPEPVEEPSVDFEEQSPERVCIRIDRVVICF